LSRSCATACPFARRIFGGIDWEALEDSAKLATPCAYVIVGDSDAERNKYQSLVAQDVTDQFDVVVVLDAPNGQDLERIDDVHMVRSLLSLALVGWKPMPDFDPIEFVGGQLILQNRSASSIASPISPSSSSGGEMRRDRPRTGAMWYAMSSPARRHQVRIGRYRSDGGQKPEVPRPGWAY
jgi:hypothetical protein